jgi:phosphoserine phosphatase
MEQGVHPVVRTLVDELWSRPAPVQVAFDADGTLWRGDIGEDLLRYLAAEGLLPRHRGRPGIYAEYERRVAVDPALGYAFAVEVMEELPEAPLQAWCDDFFARRFEGRLFAWVRPLLRALAGGGAQVWIVSASPLWPVVSGARALGVPEERVVGVRCRVTEGRLTREVQRPVPCGEGKVHWLKALEVRPALAFGNGDLDLPMLAYAERGVVVAPHGEDNALCAAAPGHRWPVLRC